MKLQHILFWLVLPLCFVCLFGLRHWALSFSAQPVAIFAQDQDPTPTENSAPAIGKLTHLYEGWRDTGTPNTQGFSYITLPFVEPDAIQSFADGVTTLDTTADQSESAGYFSTSGKGLERTAGYGVRFSVQVAQESHIRADRAGFSVLVLSSQDVSGTLGIELGFWTNEIWAQEGGEPPQLFTHAEGVTFDTTVMHDYDLMVLAEQYALYADGALILTGALRDYSAFEGQPNPYATPDLVFLGDDTGSAAVVAKIAAVSYMTNTPPSNRTVQSGEPLRIDDLGVLDLDAGGGNLTVLLHIAHGTLTLADAAPGGVAATAIQGNGTRSVTMMGNLGQINNTLAYARADDAGLIFQDATPVGASHTLQVELSDNGYSGGDAQVAQTAITITVNASILTPVPATPVPITPVQGPIYLPVLRR